MSTWAKLLALLVVVCTAATAQTAFPGIGRAATPAEIAAWDIDVRPDFKGLPAGSGSVAKGQEIWEGKCASCHGVFGESTEVFNPLVGGTTADDVKTGRVATLVRTDYPGRTTLMKVSNLSTLFDYIQRAMPWSQPKSLSADEVYAVTAYMLHLGGVLPAGHTLSDRNIREAQQLLPNRNGKTTAHALWPGKEFGGAAKPDVQGSACMKDCAVDTRIASFLPDHARNAHGNLAEQNRGIGAQRGMDSSRAGLAIAQAAAAPAPAPAADTKAIQALLQKNTCTACHAPAAKLLGPSWADVAKKHAGKADYLAGKIKAGGSGVWGAIPMPPQALAEADAKRIAAWLAAGAPP